MSSESFIIDPDDLERFHVLLDKFPFPVIAYMYVSILKEILPQVEEGMYDDEIEFVEKFLEFIPVLLEECGIEMYRQEAN